MIACEKGNLEIISTLLRLEISKIDARDLNGKTALFYAVDCDSGQNTDIVLHLLETKGCEINSECNDKETPLLRAVLKGYLNIVEILLSKGANTRACLEKSDNQKGDNALHIAARQQNQKMIALLAKHNSDFSKNNKQRETIFDILKQFNNTELQKFAEDQLIKQNVPQQNPIQYQQLESETIIRKCLNNKPKPEISPDKPQGITLKLNQPKFKDSHTKQDPVTNNFQQVGINVINVHQQNIFQINYIPDDEKNIFESFRSKSPIIQFSPGKNFIRNKESQVIVIYPHEIEKKFLKKQRIQKQQIKIDLKQTSFYSKFAQLIYKQRKGKKKAMQKLFDKESVLTRQKKKIKQLTKKLEKIKFQQSQLKVSNLKKNNKFDYAFQENKMFAQKERLRNQSKKFHNLHMFISQK